MVTLTSAKLASGIIDVTDARRRLGTELRTMTLQTCLPWCWYGWSHFGGYPRGSFMCVPRFYMWQHVTSPLSSSVCCHCLRVFTNIGKTDTLWQHLGNILAMYAAKLARFHVFPFITMVTTDHLQDPQSSLNKNSVCHSNWCCYIDIFKSTCQQICQVEPGKRLSTNMH